MFLFQLNPSQELRDKINSYLGEWKKLLETAKSLGIKMDAAEKNMALNTKEMVENENFDPTKIKDTFDAYQSCVTQLFSTDPLSVNMRASELFSGSYDELYLLYEKLWNNASSAGKNELSNIWTEFSGKLDEGGKQTKQGSLDKFFVEWNEYVTTFNKTHEKSGYSLSTVSEGESLLTSKFVISTTPKPKTNWIEETSITDYTPFYGPAKDLTRGLLLPFYPSLNPNPTERWIKTVGYTVTGAAFLVGDFLTIYKGGLGPTTVIRQETKTGLKYTLRNAWKWVDDLMVKHFGEESVMPVVKHELKEGVENLGKTESKEVAENLVKTTTKTTKLKNVTKTVTKETFDDAGKSTGKEILTETSPTPKTDFLQLKKNETVDFLKNTPKKLGDITKKVPDFVKNIDDAGNSLIESGISTSNPFNKIAKYSFAIPFKFTSEGLKFTAGVLYHIANADLPTLINNIYLRNQMKKIGEEIIHPIIFGKEENTDVVTEVGFTTFKIEFTVKSKLKIDATWWETNSADLAEVPGSQQDLVKEINEMLTEDKETILSAINKVLDWENISSDADKDAQQNAILSILNTYGTLDKLKEKAGLLTVTESTDRVGETVDTQTGKKEEVVPKTFTLNERTWEKLKLPADILVVMKNADKRNTVDGLINDLKVVKNAVDQKSAMEKIFSFVNNQLVNDDMFQKAILDATNADLTKKQNKDGYNTAMARINAIIIDINTGKLTPPDIKQLPPKPTGTVFNEKHRQTA